MKFLILAPLLFASAYSQFGFIENIANEVKDTVVDGANIVGNGVKYGVNTVGNGIVDGANEVGNFGQMVGGEVAGFGQKVADQVVKQEQAVEDHFRPHPQRDQKREREAEGEIKKAIKLSQEQRQEIKSLKEQLKTVRQQFKTAQAEVEKQGEELEKQFIEQHKEQMRELHQQIKAIRETGRRNAKEMIENDSDFDIENERLVLKEKMKELKNMSNQQRRQAKLELKKAFQQGGFKAREMKQQIIGESEKSTQSISSSKSGERKQHHGRNRPHKRDERKGGQGKKRPSKGDRSSFEERRSKQFSDIDESRNLKVENDSRDRK